MRKPGAEREEARATVAVLELDHARAHADDRAAEAVLGDLDDEIAVGRHAPELALELGRQPVASTSVPYRSSMLRLRRSQRTGAAECTEASDPPPSSPPRSLPAHAGA